MKKITGLMLGVLLVGSLAFAVDTVKPVAVTTSASVVVSPNQNVAHMNFRDANKDARCDNFVDANKDGINDKGRHMGNRNGNGRGNRGCGGSCR